MSVLNQIISFCHHLFHLNLFSQWYFNSEFLNEAQLMEVFIELMATTGFSLYFKSDER